MIECVFLANKCICLLKDVWSCAKLGEKPQSWSEEWISRLGSHLKTWNPLKQLKLFALTAFIVCSTVTNHPCFYLKYILLHTLLFLPFFQALDQIQLVTTSPVFLLKSFTLPSYTCFVIQSSFPLHAEITTIYFFSACCSLLHSTHIYSLTFILDLISSCFTILTFEEPYSHSTQLPTAFNFVFHLELFCTTKRAETHSFRQPFYTKKLSSQQTT